MKTPDPDFHIDEDLVKSLLGSQFPALVNLPIQFVGAGWDNTMFRLGEKFAVRMPRREKAIPLMIQEQKWLPHFKNKFAIPIPVPLYLGKAEFDYPCAWSIIPWLPGKTADENFPQDNQAIVLAEFLKTLHQSAPENAPVNTARAVPLAQKASAMDERLIRLKDKTDIISPKLESIWEECLNIKVPSEKVWIHGDLHPRNMLVENGVFSGIIDWGDLTAGDAATDLASIWMLFENSSARDMVIHSYQFTPDLLARAKGWAFYFGTILLDTGLVDHPAHARIGKATLERLKEL